MNITPERLNKVFIFGEDKVKPYSEYPEPQMPRVTCEFTTLEKVVLFSRYTLSKIGFKSLWYGKRTYWKVIRENK